MNRKRTDMVKEAGRRRRKYLLALTGLRTIGIASVLLYLSCGLLTLVCVVSIVKAISGVVRSCGSVGGEYPGRIAATGGQHAGMTQVDQVSVASKKRRA